MTEPKFPDVYVELVGRDGGTGAIMARVTRALTDYRDTIDDQTERDRINGEIRTFREAVFDCDYNGFLRLVMETVSVGSPEDFE